MDVCSLKDNYERYFPSVVELQDCNPGIKKSLLERAFLKKLPPNITGPSTILPSNTKCMPSMNAPSPSSDEIWSNTKTNYQENEINESVKSLKREQIYLDITSTDFPGTYEKSYETQTNNGFPNLLDYYLDDLRNENKGYVRLNEGTSLEFESEFNLIVTTSKEITSQGLPGTHRWLLYKDIKKVG